MYYHNTSQVIYQSLYLIRFFLYRSHLDIIIKYIYLTLHKRYYSCNFLYTFLIQKYEENLSLWIKNLKVNFSFRQVGIHRIPLEVGVLRQLAGLSGVIRLVDYLDCGEYCLLIMERPEHCTDLFDYITERQWLDETSAKAIFLQVVDTVLACCRRGVLHRDIKVNTFKIFIEYSVIKTDFKIWKKDKKWKA